MFSVEYDGSFRGYHTQAKKIKEGFKFIAETIKKKDYDVVALQEVSKPV